MQKISKIKKAAQKANLKPRKGKPSHPSAENMSVAVSPRQLAAIRTRRKLIAAARKLFVKHGYHRTRPQDIAKEAGLGYGTFYIHFEDKFDCYLAFIDDVYHEVVTIKYWNWSSDKPQTPEEFLPHMLKSIFDYSSAFPGIIEELLTDSRTLSGDERGGFKGADLLMKELRKWQKTGSVSRNWDSSLVTALLFVIVKAGAGFVAKSPNDQDKIVKLLTRFIINALYGDPKPPRK